MRISKDLCVNCGMCINRCPVAAIKKTDKIVDIDFDECVECGVCLRSNVCPKEAIYQQPLEYPRSVRSLMSDVLTIAPESGISGRGTEEMKTNEVTGRFPDGTVGIAVELGRPCYGARLYDAEKIAMAVAAEGVEFEACNPVTTMMSDPKTGKFKEELLNEKVLSAIVEMTVPYEKTESVLKTIYKTAETLDCFLSLDICSKVDQDGNLPHMEIVKKWESGALSTEKPMWAWGVPCIGKSKEEAAMSHTLHRVGTEENLKHDFVFLCMPSKDINHEESAPKLRRFFQLCEKNHCVTMGDCRGGNEWYQKEKYHLQDNLEGRQHMIDHVEDRAVITATFKDETDVINMLADLKKEDLGMSIVVSGLVDHVKECCHKAGLEPHTVESSLGRIGQTDLLPPNEILEIATMCGHSMVSVNFINEMIEKCRRGRCTPEEAAAELFKPCMCGIFNTDRAAMLIRKMIEE